MNLRLSIKRAVQGLSLVLVSPLALLCAMGRIGVVYELFAHVLATMPGVSGNFLRAAFYKFTLADFSIDTVIAFGSYFSRRQVTVHPNVSIGSYCIIGQVEIGARTQISSHVEIPGRRQHTRDMYGRLSSSIDLADDLVTIGEDCWIGASVVVMADVGHQTTIGAGSVVVKDIPEGVIAVGIPAKPIGSSVPLRKVAH